MPDFLNEAFAITDRLIDLRRDIHAHPELGRRETRTQKLIADTLSALGIPVRKCAETGICADLNGHLPGPVIALRADIDALPIRENTGLSYTSVNEGIMHACGHDIHTASLLGAAMLLVEHKNELHGSVRFLFQPDEEGDGGAQRMIDDGALDNVSMIFGAHTAPEIPCGSVGIRYGSAYAASNPFDLTIRGRSSHGAEPHLGKDSILAASQIVSALQTVVSRNTSPLDSAVLSIGSFHAGTARNIIAEEAKLSGVIRCFGPEARKRTVDRVESVIAGICSAMDVEYDLHVTWGYSGIINHDHETSIVRDSLEQLLGSDKVIIESVPTLTTEDFGAFLEKIPGSYWHIGTGCVDGQNYPLHNPKYAPDERSIMIAAAAHAQIVMSALGNI